jgi:hypothetical protein
MDSRIGRLLLVFGGTLLVVLFAWEVFARADELHIVEVRRNIPLSDTDPVYRDFYPSAGTEAGFKPNQVVTALRKISVKDATGTQSFGEMMVPVGQLKVIFSVSHIAVAREYKALSRDDLPMLEQAGFQVGDQIDLKGSFIDNRKPSVKTNAQKENAPATPEEGADSKSESALEPPAKPQVRTDASVKSPEPVAKPEPAAKPGLQEEVLKKSAQAADRVPTKLE